jgi:transcriptional regulator with XRE-family HTH domain
MEVKEDSTAQDVDGPKQLRERKIRNADDLDHLRTHLQRVLEERQLSPAELAAIAIVPLSTVTRILDGKVKNPGIDVVISLAKALGVTVSELVGEDPPEGQGGITSLTTEGEDQDGILRDLTRLLSDEGIHLVSCFGTSRGNRARVVLNIATVQAEQLRRIRTRIRQTPTVRAMKITDNIRVDLNSQIDDYLKKAARDAGRARI